MLLIERLPTEPIVAVSGVVSASGVAGGMFKGDELWRMNFSLDGWRVGDAEVQSDALYVTRRVTEDELGEFRKLITSYAVIRIRARVASDAVLGRSQALLEEFVGADTSDAELNARAEQLQRPVTFQDSSFGELTLDRRLEWFTGKAVWNGDEVSLNLSAKGREEVEEALATARSLWSSQELWHRRIGDFAVLELLRLKNDAWLDEDEAELTADQFKSKMKLETISVYPDGSFEFWHDDGDLFWGHSIQIGGNLAEGPNHADIPG